MVKFLVDTTNLQREVSALGELSSTVSGNANKIQAIRDCLDAGTYRGVIESLERISIGLRNSGRHLANLSKAGKQIVTIYNETEKSIIDKIIWDIIKAAMVGLAVQLIDDLVLTDSERMELEETLNTLLNQHTYVDVNGVERIDIYGMSDEERQQVIEIYERLNREYAANMNQCLQPLKAEGYDDDIIYIKALAYTAPEPYRTLYLENAGDIEIIDLHYDKSKPQCYSTMDVDGDGKNETGLCLNIDDCWVSDKEKRYRTFFHESGHALDDILDGEKGDGLKYTSSYTDENGDHLTDALQRDVRGKIRECVWQKLEETELSDFEKAVVTNQIANGIMNCYDQEKDRPVMQDCRLGELDILSAEDMQNVLDYTVDEIRNANAGPSSDIYGGYSGNLLACQDAEGNLTNCHPAIQTDSENILYSYWIEGTDASTESVFVPRIENGSVVYKNSQASEFWAENFSAQMTGSESELNGISGRLDEGVRFVEDMIR